MRDIVERLRDQARTGAPKFDAGLELEAADEIERLRAALDKSVELVQLCDACSETSLEVVK